MQVTFQYCCKNSVDLAGPPKDSVEHPLRTASLERSKKRTEGGLRPSLGEIEYLVAWLENEPEGKHRRNDLGDRRKSRKAKGQGMLSDGGRGQSCGMRVKVR